MACYRCDYPVAAGEGVWCDKCWKDIQAGGFYWNNDLADAVINDNCGLQTSVLHPDRVVANIDSQTWPPVKREGPKVMTTKNTIANTVRALYTGLISQEKIESLMEVSSSIIQSLVDQEVAIAIQKERIANDQL